MDPIAFAVVGFDLDGTLLDTRADIAAALNHALAHDGRPLLPVERVVPMVGGGVRLLLQQALEATGVSTGEEVERLLPVLMEHYRAHPCDHATIYPGVIDTLERLTASGVACGIVTNKPQAITDLTLDRTGLGRLVGCVLGGDAPGIARGKPAPDALLAMQAALGGGRTAFVGDSRYDVTAARAAGMPAIACRFGFAPEEVDMLGADAVIGSMTDLVPALTHL